ncbi:hypothetical protein BN159_1039 [Streptomyces davaonensis JCM 4913]|uniref:non-specific serine/threonine protein kinase n=1 Tax=Streptomyces davaonensis (strain DSM 101723 / JCM 4913 / KCC S-0913 / 768) TaxID=1214101 RepID=K4QWL4_STRDJ|nr:hypothetical protein BN159_1039 [Streptomyces davaonensis JCM 4913]
MNTAAAPGRSAAVLIGVSRYDHLAPLPGVRGNVVDLAEQLRDPAVWGLSEERCRVVLEPTDATAAFEPLRETADGGLDTLVVYYAGHGLIDPNRGDLGLGLPGSVVGRPYTSLPYYWLSEELKGLRIERRIVILDCCYSGRALGMMSDAQSAVANGAEIEGTYLIASADESAQAVAPPGARHTAFTGELISLLAGGVPDGPELLPLDTVFQHLSAACRSRSFPLPQKRVRNSAGQLPIFRNRAYAPMRAGRLLAERYELGQLIEADSATETYAARDTELDRPVLIKMMRPEAAADAALAAGFRRRAKARAALRHPFVAVLHDIGTTRRDHVPCPYLVTESVAGETLGTFVRRRQNHPDWVVAVVCELLGVLEHAHGLGVFGWRLDPESVVFTAENHVKVVDLGDAPDGHDDLLEVGRLLRTLLAGAAPPTSYEVDAVVRRALATDPAQRYRSAGDLWRELYDLRGRATRPEPVSAPESLWMRFAAGSHKGMIREQNEDSGYAGPRLLALADGLGAAPAGAVASSEVIASLVELDDDTGDPPDLLTPLHAAAQRAQRQLAAMAEEDPQLRGMATTLTALLWVGSRLGLVHIGDSRAYLLRDGTLTQITQDNRPMVSTAEEVDPEFWVRKALAGDRYLLCTDGLSDVVSDESIEECLASHLHPQETVGALVTLALRGGGPGNISCIVADFLATREDDGPLSDTPVVIGAVAENQTDLYAN